MPCRSHFRTRRTLPYTLLRTEGTDRDFIRIRDQLSLPTLTLSSTLSQRRAPCHRRPLRSSDLHTSAEGDIRDCKCLVGHAHLRAELTHEPEVREDVISDPRTM